MNTKFFSIKQYLHKQKKGFYSIALVFSYSFPLVIGLWSIFSGNIPFWYDPARDLLLATNNLHKLTLIGSTTGIPGIFYGPYWIWLLSFGLIFSKDPRIVSFLVEAIPYFIIFPFILFQFNKIFNKQVIILIWLLFMLGSGLEYATQIWNPDLAPLLFLAIIYLLVFTANTVKTRKNYLLVFISGFLTGLLLSLHISFGLGVLLGSSLFWIVDFCVCLRDFYRWKFLVINRIETLALFFLGIFITFLPTILFELRHGFIQIQIAVKTITSPFAVVGQTGLDKQEILATFLGKQLSILHIPHVFLSHFYLSVLLLIALIAVQVNRRIIRVKKTEVRLFLLLFLVSISTLYLYITSKNPVWEYHFIGVEIIFLLLIAFIVNKLSFLVYPLVLWVFILVLSRGYLFVQDITRNPYRISTLITKEYAVKIIANDVKDADYTVFVYNPSIYTYDYSYLFGWLVQKEIPYDPGAIVVGTGPVYLMIPSVHRSVTENFINYRTPSRIYKTTALWDIPDGTEIIKRERKSIR